MIALAAGWEITVERGPSCLVIRLKPGNELETPDDLAETIWQILEQHFVFRVILELDEVRLVDSRLLGQLLKLVRRIQNRGGLLRLCGLSPFNRQVVALNGLDKILPAYGDRHQAIMLSDCRKPR